MGRWEFVCVVFFRFCRSMDFGGFLFASIVRFLLSSNFELIVWRLVL